MRVPTSLVEVLGYDGSGPGVPRTVLVGQTESGEPGAGPGATELGVDAGWLHRPPGPGGIAAALFVREFTAGLPWAHLDIAGPARAEQAHDEVNPGATGFAARTLVALACSLSGYPHP